MSLTDWGEALILNHVLRTDTFAKPTKVELTLHSTEPDENGRQTTN